MLSLPEQLIAAAMFGVTGIAAAFVLFVKLKKP